MKNMIFTVLASIDQDSMQNLQPPSFTRLFVSFIMLMGALALVVFILKKLGQSRIKFLNSSSAIKVIDKKSLSPKTALYIVEIEGQKLIAIESQNHVKLQNFDSKTLQD